MGPCSQRFEELAAKMRASASESSLGKGASTAEVTDAEEQLGVKLPESYKCFLREFGIASWPDYIYGIHPLGLSGRHIVAKTEKARHELQPHLPHHLIPFSPDGGGNEYCLDTARLAGGECPVVLWDHELDEDQQPEEAYASFLDWLEFKIELALEE